MKLQFSRQAVEKYSNMKLMKIPPVEHSCSMRIDGRTEGQTNMMKLIVASRKFAKATKNW